MNAPVPSPQVHYVTTDDGTVLLDVGQGRFYGLNPTGSTVWLLLLRGHDVEQITDHLAAGFDAPPDRVRADVVTVVAQLCERGLLLRRQGLTA